MKLNSSENNVDAITRDIVAQSHEKYTTHIIGSTKWKSAMSVNNKILRSPRKNKKLIEFFNHIMYK